MRKITENAIYAFNANRYFVLSNTTVRSDGSITELTLHGNVIARKTFNNATGSFDTFITNAGWESNTTKERLNGLDGVSIYQKNWQWYLNDKVWNGKWTKI